MSNDIVTLKEASTWVLNRFNKKILVSNISYLVQYGQIKKVLHNGTVKVRIADLENYYSMLEKQETSLRKKLGEELNWTLSFSNLREVERTKHVHRLHPYKGKFIPQLVEYFLDDHTDEFKKNILFKKGDIVLDPFCGSGTTLVQANELGLHSIGIDISAFNTLISNVKIEKHDLTSLHLAIKEISSGLKEFIHDKNWIQFNVDLTSALALFNKKCFPSPEYKYQIRNNAIDEMAYANDKEKEFQPIFTSLIEKHDLRIQQDVSPSNSFLNEWFLYPIRQEIDFLHGMINSVKDSDVNHVLQVILSRTIRSCRATTHADLASLRQPVLKPYYCRKHYKICKPLFSSLKWWERYAKDTVKRLGDFDAIRTDTIQKCITGDSRNLDIIESIRDYCPELELFTNGKKFNGIFSSPPYVGLINYHEQHAYAYDLFEYERNDEKEIGPMFKGKSKSAREAYVKGISLVLSNCKKYLRSDSNILLVANDKDNLYPEIAKRAGLIIVNEYLRPVLNRTEKDKSAFSEKIFHMKFPSC